MQPRSMKWWARWPAANVGVLAQHVVILDVDNHDGSYAGLVSLQELGEPPETPTATTPSGGMHLYFEGTGRNRTNVRPGIDIRGRRGFVVAPPSIDERGAYLWRKGLSPDNVPLAPIPEWLRGLMAEPSLSPPTSRQPAVATSEGRIRKGTRHDTLIKLGRRFRHYGAGLEDLIAYLVATNQARCESPLPAEEVVQIAAWCANQPSFAGQYAAMDRRWSAPRSGAPSAVTDFNVMRALLGFFRQAQSVETAVSTRRVASSANVEQKTARRSLGRLVLQGEVSVERGIPGRASRYRLNTNTASAEPIIASAGTPADRERTDRQQAEELMLRRAFPRRWNAVRIMRELYGGDRSAAELASALRLSRTAIGRNLLWLEERWIVLRVSDRWRLSEWWRYVLEEMTDVDEAVMLIAWAAEADGMLDSWQRRQQRMDGEIERFDEYFRARYGVDRMTGEIVATAGNQ